jgi:putative CocE/NonD family hydrolase
MKGREMMFKRRSVLLGLMLAGLSARVSAQDVQTLYDSFVVEKNVMVPMRDGVRLATDIYRPARAGTAVSERLPVLLQRTPYNKSGGRGTQIELFVKQGYVVVVQDSRGRYNSQGVFVKYFESDAYDGFDTIDWVSKLPYGNGEVGMWGTSYVAHTQSDPAKLRPPALKTIVLNFGGLSNIWEHSVRNHGAFELGFQMIWAFNQVRAETKDSVVRRMLDVETPRKWFSALPLRKGLSPLAVAPNFEDYMFRMATIGGAKEWKGLGTNWEDYYEQTADIPMLHVGGWYDVFTGSTIDNFVGLSRIKKAPVRLLMGPWVHGGNERTLAGDVEFGPEAAVRDFSTSYHLRWFDHFLKGKATVPANEPRARLYVMGTGDGHKDSNGHLFHGGYWRNETDWPIPNTRFTPYYFHADGSLSPVKPTAQTSSTTYTFDPENPVPTIGGAYNVSPGGFNQREAEAFQFSKPPYLPLKARRDVLVFQTEPLAEDVEVVGPIVIRLYAASSSVDTDFTAKLVDVYPPSADYPSGYDLNLTDGIIRARYRSSPDTQELMQPGTVYEFTIEPFPTANVFKKGNRIRIDISSSNFPKFDVNPNTGEPLWQHRRTVKADNTVHHSATHSSHVIIPIAPAGRRQPT